MNTITATFLIRCQDRKGILAAITNFFYKSGLNILICQQYTDVTRNQYYMRLKLDLQGLPCARQELEREFDLFAKQYEAHWSVHYSDYIPRVAVMVSKAPHCLYDILVKQREGVLKCEIPLIIGNHPDLEYTADQFRIPFFCLPVTKETKQEQEKKKKGFKFSC